MILVCILILRAIHIIHDIDKHDLEDPADAQGNHGEMVTKRLMKFRFK